MRKLHPEVKAFRKVTRALRDLDDAARLRVLEIARYRVEDEQGAMRLSHEDGERFTRKRALSASSTGESTTS